MSEEFFGEIPEYPAGTEFKDRRATHDAGVHRGLQGGIHGTKRDGANSIVMSGGYVDDQDSGDVIIYTGADRIVCRRLSRRRCQH